MAVNRDNLAGEEWGVDIDSQRLMMMDHWDRMNFVRIVPYLIDGHGLKILLQKRDWDPDIPHPGVWTTPGRYVSGTREWKQHGTNPLKAANGVLSEELGIGREDARHLFRNAPLDMHTPLFHAKGVLYEKTDAGQTQHVEIGWYVATNISELAGAHRSTSLAVNTVLRALSIMQGSGLAFFDYETELHHGWPSAGRPGEEPGPILCDREAVDTLAAKLRKPEGEATT